MFHDLEETAWPLQVAVLAPPHDLGLATPTRDLDNFSGNFENFAKSQIPVFRVIQSSHSSLVTARVVKTKVDVSNPAGDKIFFHHDLW